MKGSFPLSFGKKRSKTRGSDIAVTIQFYMDDLKEEIRGEDEENEEEEEERFVTLKYADDTFAKSKEEAETRAKKMEEW